MKLPIGDPGPTKATGTMGTNPGPQQSGHELVRNGASRCKTLATTKLSASNDKFLMRARFSDDVRRDAIESEKVGEGT